VFLGLVLALEFGFFGFLRLGLGVVFLLGMSPDPDPNLKPMFFWGIKRLLETNIFN